jgi:hypothetical protein
LHVSSILVAATNFLEVALVRLSPCLAALPATVVLLTGCGGDDHGTRVAYTVRAVDPAAISGEVAAVLRGRLAAAGVVGASVSAARDEIVISADGDDDRTRATIVAMTVPGRLRIYDWEANVLGPDGRPGRRGRIAGLRRADPAGSGPRGRTHQLGSAACCARRT